MKLNHDCVRAVLLSIESLPQGKFMGTSQLNNYPLLSQFDPDESVYAVEKLIEAGYLDAVKIAAIGGTSYKIKAITWNGHQFLDNIRDEGVWNDAKKVVSNVASVSISIVSDVAANLLKRTLGLG